MKSAVRLSHYANAAREAPSLIWPSTHVAGEASSAISHPPVIALDFTAGNVPSDDILSVGDWPSFDAILSGLSHVQKVILGFDTTDSMSCFVQEVVEVSMTHLRTKLEYQCAIFHHKEPASNAMRPEGFFVSADPRKAAGA